MVYSAERPAARLERVREHDAPSLGVVRQRPARGAARAQGQFRSFVSKVIFGHEECTAAGMWGVAAVSVRVEGLSIGES